MDMITRYKLVGPSGVCYLDEGGVISLLKDFFVWVKENCIDVLPEYLELQAGESYRWVGGYCLGGCERLELRAGINRGYESLMVVGELRDDCLSKLSLIYRNIKLYPVMDFCIRCVEGNHYTCDFGFNDISSFDLCMSWSDFEDWVKSLPERCCDC